MKYDFIDIKLWVSLFLALSDSYVNCVSWKLSCLDKSTWQYPFTSYITMAAPFEY